MKQSFIAAVVATLGCLAASHAALAASSPCGKDDALQIRGDTPGAISYDVYRQLRPLDAHRLALFQDAGTVKRLPDGLGVCEIADDGVADPSAVLVHVPQGKMAWWVSAANVENAD
ncbi:MULTISPECIES: hypothetical protein [Paraburkholderia]|jgi:hypothetical protein|uniref:hypothetical protein n=1 Tax=Paraburkholderia TaxID=1822464 RepID=UPI0015DA9BF5|nr:MULTISPECIES: hypothetical protein [Paraburkholderia]BEU24028.1 hypothetical protein PBP221_41680 [Paraburkholderia sp. 22B1P]CAG9261768.1 conserved exported hypothetical protein [Paraburkholderia caribensis]